MIATLTDAYRRSRPPIIATPTEAGDSVMDPGAQKDSINALLRLLWHGDALDSFSPHTF